MKVLALVHGCHDCPCRTYYSGGRYECSEANVMLSEKYDGKHPYGPTDMHPEWCPLIEYPAAARNRMAEEIAALRQQPPSPLPEPPAIKGEG